VVQTKGEKKRGRLKERRARSKREREREGERERQRERGHGRERQKERERERQRDRAKERKLANTILTDKQIYIFSYAWRGTRIFNAFAITHCHLLTSVPL
jgi:hypothetical protein